MAGKMFHQENVNGSRKMVSDLKFFVGRERIKESK